MWSDDDPIDASAGDKTAPEKVDKPSAVATRGFTEMLMRHEILHIQFGIFRSDLVY